jgi:hypothetical protein
MEAAFDAVKRQLFDQLHDVVRQKIFYVRPPIARTRHASVCTYTYALRLAPTPHRRTDDVLHACAGAGAGRGGQQRLLGAR